MRSRGQLEITTLGSSSWMPYAPQGVKGTDDDIDDDKLIDRSLLDMKRAENASVQKLPTQFAHEKFF